MAPGSTLVYQVGIEFAVGSGVYVDLSSRVTDLTITRPAGTRLGEASPTTLEVNFLNHPASAAEVATWGVPAGIDFCPLSPESPAAAFYPNVNRDRMIKVTAIWNGGASTAIRFWGWIDSWTPAAGTLPPGTATVSISASCVLSRYARRELLTTYGEYNQQNPNYDYYPLNEAPDSTVFKRYAQEGQAGSDGQLILPFIIPGKLELQAAEGGHATDGQMELSRGAFDSFPSPVIMVPLRRGGNVLSTFEAWMKLNLDPSGSNDTVISAYTIDNILWWQWTVALVGTNMVWRMLDNTGTVKVEFDTKAPRDEGWHFWQLRFGSNNSDIFYSNRGNRYAVGVGSGASWSYDPRKALMLVVGGKMNPGSLGKTSNTLQGGISSFRIAYNGDAVSGQGYNDPGTALSMTDYYNVMDGSSLGVDAKVGGAFYGSFSGRTVLSSNKYSNLLERWNEFIRSNLFELLTRPNGQRDWNGPAAVRPTTVALTLDAEGDLSAPDGGWQPIKDESPTRVTVTGPVGSTSYVRTDVEAASGIRLDGGSIDVNCGSLDAMKVVAAFATIQTGTRLRSFGFDPTTTSTDKLTAAMALRPRQRVRITGIPPALTGQSYLDVFAYGWVERFDATDGSCGWTFETWLADDPPEGLYDDDEYGRFAIGDGAATGTSGTAVGTVAAGTLVLTSTSPITVNPASYPLSLDWGGERVTVPSAPASATSPQTLTLSARGVAPTVARIHAAGDPVEIWHADRFGV